MPPCPEAQARAAARSVSVQCTNLRGGRQAGQPPSEVGLCRLPEPPASEAANLIAINRAKGGWKRQHVSLLLWPNPEKERSLRRGGCGGPASLGGHGLDAEEAGVLPGTQLGPTKAGASPSQRTEPEGAGNICSRDTQIDGNPLADDAHARTRADAPLAIQARHPFSL